MRMNSLCSDVPSRVVFLVGASGSGKTVIGSRVSSLIRWELYDTDAEILKMTGADRISDIFETQG